MKKLEKFADFAMVAAVILIAVCPFMLLVSNIIAGLACVFGILFGGASGIASDMAAEIRTKQHEEEVYNRMRSRWAAAYK